jgi:hypothetical protein
MLIKGKMIGWQSFRHSLVSKLGASRVDLTQTQGSLSTCTCERNPQTKRDNNNKVMDMVLEAGKGQNSAPSRQGTPLLPGSKRGAEIIQRPSAPSRASDSFVTVP